MNERDREREGHWQNEEKKYEIIAGVTELKCVLFDCWVSCYDLFCVDLESICYCYSTIPTAWHPSERENGKKNEMTHSHAEMTTKKIMAENVLGAKGVQQHRITLYYYYNDASICFAFHFLWL